MRKLYLLLFTALLCHDGWTQNLTDSLRKYSYLIQSRDSAHPVQATGFFVRHHNRLFFATAAHCLTGWDPFHFRRIQNFPDTLYIRISNDTSRLKYLPLPVAAIKEASQPFREFETPDVFVLEIKNPKRYNVFSVEKYFDETPKCESAKVAWVLGFPRGVANNRYLTDRQFAFSSASELDQAYCVYAFRPEMNRPDYLNYFISVESAATGTGLSGSPVYLLTDEKRIVFGGIYIGGAEKGIRNGMVLRPEYVIEKIITEMARR